MESRGYKHKNKVHSPHHTKSHDPPHMLHSPPTHMLQERGLTGFGGQKKEDYRPFIVKPVNNGEGMPE
jgi:hypothetical protein